MPGGGRLAAVSSLRDDINDLRTASQAAGGGLAGLSAGLGAIGGPAVVATAGIAGLAVALSTVTAAAFESARAFSDAGSAIYDMSRNTGISTETLSGFKVAAQESGASLEQVGAGLGRFNRLLGEAAGGSKEAAETLKRFGLEPQEALRDSEAALQQVLSRIGELPEGTERAAAAQQAFGRGGAELVSTLETMQFSLAGARDQASALGQMFDAEAARAADEFGDTLDQLQAAASGLAIAFGRQIAPVITDAMHDITGALNDNRSAVASWGSAFADVIRGVRAAAESDLVALANTITGVTGALSMLQFAGQVSGVGGMIGGLRSLGASQPQGGQQDRLWQTVPLPSSGFFGGGGGGRRRGGGGGGGGARRDPVAELLRELEQELANTGQSSNLAALNLRLLRAEFKNMPAEIRKTAESLAIQRDELERSNDAVDKFTTFADRLAESLKPPQTAVQEFDAELAKLTEAIDDDRLRSGPVRNAIAQARWNAQLKDLVDLGERLNRLDILNPRLAPSGPANPLSGRPEFGPEYEQPRPIIISDDPDPGPLWDAQRRREIFQDFARDVDDIIGGSLEKVFRGDFGGLMEFAVGSFRDALARMSADLIQSEVSGFLRGLIKTGISAIAGAFGFGAPKGFGGAGAGGSFADGGHYNAFAPRLTGERGPELDFPGHSGTIVSNEQIRRALGAGGTQTVINNTNNIMLPPLPPGNHVQRRSRRQLAEEIVSVLR